MKLRDYQVQAVEKTIEAFRRGFARVMLELGPGAGKSVIAAELANRAMTKSPEARVLVLCHVREILTQNRDALHRLNPDIRSSIYCNGLNQKDMSGPVVFASRDSIRAHQSLPYFDLIIVDECHMVSNGKTSSYQQIFSNCRARYIIGMSATPYRLVGGKVYGKKKPFEICSYRLGIRELVAMDRLSTYRFIQGSTSIRVGKSNREITKAEYEALGAKASQDEEIKNARDWILSSMMHCKCVIIYCCSREHARRISEAIPGCAYIDGETKTKDRDTLIQRMKNGLQKFVANCNVLTTGTDIPICDGIVFLRPTMSASLYIQAIGRALRVFPGKEEATILELTDNLDRFGDITNPMDYSTAERDDISLSLGQDAPTKECPECEMEVSASTRVCPYCDYMFIKPRENPVSPLVELKVKSLSYKTITTRNGHDAILVTIHTDRGVFTDWLNINHPNQWARRSGLAKWKILRSGEKITYVMMKDMDQKYPKVFTYHTSPTRLI